jgi:hypothetical protein
MEHSMDQQTRRKIYEALAAPFAEDAIERTDGRVTGKGYSTTGIKYQYIVNRLNEVLGLGGFRVERTVSVRQVATTKGRPAFEATCEIKLQLGEWREAGFVPFAEAIADGGHTAMTEADARKGAFTNGFKKAAAFFGVGRQAYEGTLDDDSVPTDEARLKTASATHPAATQLRSNPPRRDSGASDGEFQPMSEMQRRTLFRLATQRGIAPDNIAGWLKVQLRVDNLKAMTADEAGHLIEELQATNGAGPHMEVRR